MLMEKMVILMDYFYLCGIDQMPNHFFNALGL